MNPPPMNEPARLLAFYLPQFHPIPENDEWWGKGFTEWTNTAKAKPLFPGHYQPHVPADLGFYDLRVPETRMAQADMARAYGIEGFCYYHYWFAGRRILQRPFQEVLASGQPDFPFCLCWANETWTGIWYGARDRVLIQQTYPGEDDHRAHFQALLPAFTDPRHVTVHGKPMFLIFKPEEIPHTARTMDFWRTMAMQAGLPGLHLVGVFDLPHLAPSEYGLDAVVVRTLPEVRPQISRRRQPMTWLRYKWQVKAGLPTIYRFAEVLDTLMPRKIDAYTDYPNIVHAWDNSPRSGRNALVLRGSTPELFRILLRRALEVCAEAPRESKFVFLKAWNEWAEGNHLEPDLKFGHGYLQVIREELDSFAHSPSSTDVSC
jgi:lipopolysaccharide biosynthesis protein